MLIWALIIMSTLAITSASAILLVTSNESAFGRDNSSGRALDITEAGLNAAIAALKSSTNTSMTSLSNSGTLDGGTWSYTATQTASSDGNPDDFTWTIDSTGVYGGITHEIVDTLGESVTTPVTTGTQTVTTTTPASPAYGYGVFLGAASSDCTTSGQNQNNLSGSASITTSAYIAGSLCLSGGAVVAEPTTSSGGTVSLYIGKKLSASGESSPVGVSTKKIAQATIVGGCLDANHNVMVACSKQGNPTSNTSSSTYGSGVWANAYSSTQNVVTKPTASTSWYSNAEPGPMHPCNSYGSNVSTFPNDNQTGSQPWSLSKFMSHMLDGDSTRNTSLGNVDPLELVNNWSPIMNSFDCRFYDSERQPRRPPGVGLSDRRHDLLKPGNAVYPGHGLHRRKPQPLGKRLRRLPGRRDDLRQRHRHDERRDEGLRPADRRRAMPGQLQPGAESSRDRRAQLRQCHCRMDDLGRRDVRGNRLHERRDERERERLGERPDPRGYGHAVGRVEELQLDQPSGGRPGRREHVDHDDDDHHLWNSERRMDKRAGLLGTDPLTDLRSDESGFTLLEMLIAMFVLSVAIGALVTVFSAAALSLQRSSERGTAVTMAEAQIEIYRTVPLHEHPP